MYKTAISKEELLVALAAGTYGYATGGESPFSKALLFGLAGGLAARARPKTLKVFSEGSNNLASGLVQKAKTIDSQKIMNTIAKL